jgi:hypothetical protein
MLWLVLIGAAPASAMLWAVGAGIFAGLGSVIVQAHRDDRALEEEPDGPDLSV